MKIMADSRDRCDCGHAPEVPLSVNPAVSPSVDVIADGADDKVLIPVLVLPGVRLCVGGFSTDRDAAEWWKELAVAALYASLYYQGESESAL